MRELLLIGTGRMARQYVPVLSALKIRTIAIGRSEEGSRAFKEETGIETIPGGLVAWKKLGRGTPRTAIITVDADKLAVVALDAIALGIRHILLEKPGGMSLKELRGLERKASARKAKVYIAYNRRYYGSVRKAREIIQKDGGATSFSFIFNERLGQHEKLKELSMPSSVQANWFIVNATHVIDLAFYLGGLPKRLVGSSVAGPLWAPHPTLFAGAGMTKKGTPFSYHSNWELPGPWSVEVGTKKRKIILAPLESLKVEEDGKIEEIAPADEIDTDFKPGLYLEVKEFLEGTPDLPTLKEQREKFSWYEKIRDGTV